MEAPVRSDSHLRVLVVDDNRDAADCLSLLLGLWGHDVRVAYDGLGGWQVACDYRPHVLLLDLALPNLDGYRLARQLRQRPEFAEAILIAVTGFTDRAHRQEAVEAGFDLYLVKPTEASELERVLALVRKTKDLPLAADTFKLGDTTKLRPNQEK